MKLFDIPHFERSTEVYACVNMLLSCIHGGYLWIERSVSIDIELIVHITRLSLQGEDP
jgi:hypothetical protein